MWPVIVSSGIALLVLFTATLIAGRADQGQAGLQIPKSYVVDTISDDLLTACNDMVAGDCSLRGASPPIGSNP